MALMRMPTIGLLFFVLLCRTLDAHAGQAVEENVPGDEAELNKLLSVLEKHTEIATKTKLNADYVPGIVTVLSADDLAARGVQNLWEALALVPGFELSMESDGKYTIKTRGNGKTFGFGVIKFLLDSVALNLPVTGVPPPVFSIPVEQIDRIEVIRGPGSALHGEFAYLGVVNIITRLGSGRIFGRLGKYADYTGGGHFVWADDENKLRFNLSLTGMDTDGADVKTGPDLFAVLGPPSSLESNAPGPANEERNGRWAFFNLDYRDFSLHVSYNKASHGDHFGVARVLPPPEDRLVGFNTNMAVEARQAWHFSPQLTLDFKLGWLQDKLESDRFFLSPAMFASPYLKHSKRYATTDLKWRGWERHSVLLSGSFSQDKLDQVWWEANFLPSNPPTPLPGLQKLTGADNWMLEDRRRRLGSLSLQDEYDLTERMTLTAGLRYDDYDDVGKSLTTRLAGVWLAGEQHVLKAQYAKAFRPPTFIEMYGINNPVAIGNPDISAQTVETWELGYIYTNGPTIGRATLFYSIFDDLITNTGGIFANSSGIRNKGLELELEYKINALFRLDGNLGFAVNRDRQTEEAVAGAAKWQGNFGLFYEPKRDWLFNLQYRYVGKRTRDSVDLRSDLRAYQTVAVTGSVFNLGSKGLSLRAGVKNLFNADVRYPAPFEQTPFGLGASYPEDYPRPGRQWWLQVVYDF